jgi:hypothetical protein
LAPHSANWSLADAAEMAPPDISVDISLGERRVLGYFPHRTKVILYMTGSSTISDGRDSWTYDLLGHPAGAGGGIVMTSNLFGLDPDNVLGLTEMTDTVDVEGELVLQQRGQQIFVGDDGRPWSMSGHATGSFRRIEATLGIGVQGRFPYTIDEIRSAPGFSMTLIPRSVEGTTLAAADPSAWVFTPDSGGVPTPACTRVTRVLCDVSPMESGTVTMTGYANAGPPVTASIHITIPVPKITLTIDKDSVKAGESVHVTATITEASSSRIESFTFSAPGATGTCMTNRAPAPPECNIVPTASGTITAQATLNGKLVTSNGKEIHVKEECPLFADTTKTDPLFKDPAVQKMMRDLANATGWDKPLRQQAERGAYLVSKDGVTSMIPYRDSPALPANPCSSSGGSLQRDDLRTAGYTILADIHTHPNAAPAEPDPGNCYDFDGRKKILVTPPNGVLRLNPAPSSPDYSDWNTGPGETPPTYPGYVLGPKGLFKFENKGAGLVKYPPVPVSSCVGNQSSKP